jgi:hypothetical protein
MDDLESGFVGTDIVHGKDGSDFINPGSKIVGNTTINSLLNVGSNLIDFQTPSLKRGELLTLFNIEMVKLVILLMEKSIELITRNIVLNVEILENFLDLQRTSDQNPLSFFAVLNDLWF